jgi:hypothetical protein
VGDWRVLQTGDGDVVVAADYETGQPGPSLPQLVSRLSGRSTVVAPTPSVSISTCAEWVATCREFVAGSGGRIRGVLGYCAGAALACGLAADLAAESTTVPVLLFDPEAVRPETYYFHFARSAERYEETVDPDVFDDAVEQARALCRAAEPSLAQDLAAVHEQLTAAAFAEMEIDADVGAELCDRFASYLRFLDAAVDAGYERYGGPAEIVLSQGYAVPTGLRGATRTVAATHDDLLTNPVTVQLTNQLLG